MSFNLLFLNSQNILSFLYSTAASEPLEKMKNGISLDEVSSHSLVDSWTNNPLVGKSHEETFSRFLPLTEFETQYSDVPNVSYVLLDLIDDKVRNKDQEPMNVTDGE